MAVLSNERKQFLLHQKCRKDNHNSNQKVLTQKELKEGICKISKAYGISKVCLFGSYAYGMPDSNSDIDLLVDFGNCKGIDCIGFVLDIEKHFGKKVDHISIPYLKDDFKKEINGREVLMYEG